MTSDEKKATLLSLLANWENEVVEFKSGGRLSRWTEDAAEADGHECVISR